MNQQLQKFKELLIRSGIGKLNVRDDIAFLSTGDDFTGRGSGVFSTARSTRAMSSRRLLILSRATPQLKLPAAAPCGGVILCTGHGFDFLLLHGLEHRQAQLLTDLIVLLAENL